MTGRGRPRKAIAPGAECTSKKTTEESKEAEQKRCTNPEKGKTKEQKPKNREQKKPGHVVGQPEETTNHFTGDLNKRGKNKPGATGKTCTARTTSGQTASPVQPDTPEGRQTSSLKSNAATNAPVATAKAKPRGGKLNGIKEETDVRQEHLEEGAVRPGNKKGKTVKNTQEKTEMMKEVLPEASLKTTKTRAAKSNVKEPTEDRTEMKKTHEDTRALNLTLNKTLKTLKIKMKDKSNSAGVINRIIKNIVAHLKDKTECFKNVEEPLRTGSYYENLKISSPDEFDVMIPLLVERVEIEPFGDDGAFYSVQLKRTTNPLIKFQDGETLSASRMLSEFRDEVKKSVKPFEEWKMDRKKPGCPAVTLSTTVQSVTISLDVVLCLMVKSSWPAVTTDGLKIEGWLGTKVRRDYRFKPYYLVPKYEGIGAVEKDGVLAKDAWRISFSHVEKAILKNHGSEKTCCEKGGVNCCRKDCLKLLKHLLSLLKEEHSSLGKFCSYHAKTTLLHACCSRPSDRQWSASDLSRCFQTLLSDFQAHLRGGELYNFFIPEQNLLSGLTREKRKVLADRLEEERREGFPIFIKYLSKTDV